MAIGLVAREMHQCYTYWSRCCSVETSPAWRTWQVVSWLKARTASKSSQDFGTWSRTTYRCISHCLCLRPRCSTSGGILQSMVSKWFVYSMLQLLNSLYVNRNCYIYTNKFRYRARQLLLYLGSTLRFGAPFSAKANLAWLWKIQNSAMVIADDKFDLVVKQGVANLLHPILFLCVASQN